VALNRGYAPPSLTKIPSKGNVWYVVVTKPAALRDGKQNIQVRRSTGTTDQRIARTKQSKIVEQIYAEWDRLLERDPFLELLEENGFKDPIHNLSAKKFVESQGRVEAAMQIWMKLVKHRRDHHPAADEIFKYLNHEEALEFRHIITPQEDPHPAAIRANKHVELRQFLEELDGRAVYSDRPKVSKPTTIVNQSGCRTILDYLPDYMGARKWASIRLKTKLEAKSKIQRCAEIIGDLPLDQIFTHHGYAIAASLDDAGKSNSTIKAHVNALSLMIEHGSTRLIDDSFAPARPFLTSNSLKGISLREYGTKKRSWQPLTEEQLFRLFRQDMPCNDRLLLSILITTGMRLDEAALLSRKQLKIDRNGIRYFDLSMGAVVKNDKFAARTVAIPDCLDIPPLEDGLLFDFPRNADGKASSNASKELNKKYFHPIRKSANDDRKVVHSLRHNLTGFLLNLTDPAPSSEHMDWITGHGMQGGATESERQRTYAQDPDLSVKYAIINRVKHPWLE